MDDMVNRDGVTPETETGSEAMGTTKVISAAAKADGDIGGGLSAEELGKTRVVGDSDDNLISGIEQGILNSLPIEVLYPNKETAVSPSEPGIPVPPPAPDPQPVPAAPVPAPAPQTHAESRPSAAPKHEASSRAAEPVKREQEKEAAPEEKPEKKPVREKRFLSGLVVVLLTLTLVAGGSGVVIGCCVFNAGIVQEILRESNYAASAEEYFRDGLKKIALSCQADESSVDNVLAEGKMAADIQLYVSSVLNGEEVTIERASIEEAFIDAIDKDYASRKLRINEEGMATLKEVAAGVGGLYEQAVSVPGIKTLAYLREHFSIILGLVVANIYALSLVFVTVLVKLRRKHHWGIAMVWYAFIASALVLGGIPLAGLLTGRYKILAVHNSVMTSAMTMAIRTISIYMVIVGAIYAVCGIITTVIFLTRRDGR